MARKVRTTGTDAANTWANQMVSNVSKIQSGVDAVTVAPTQKAAEAKDKWFAGVQRAHTENRFADGCSKVTLNDWKTITKAKIGTNLSSGVTAAKTKTATAFTNLYTYMNGILPTIDDMPNVTLEDNIAKSAAMIRAMASYKA